MYWTHLIFALFVVLVFKSLSAAKPGYLDFDNLPETNFSCENKVIGGYYADVETGCQMFHVCTIGQKGNGEVTDIKFLCLNGTVFDQETRVCERIDEVDCSKSEDFFGLNLELYGNSNGHQGGIQPEEEFECEDCSTEDDYDETTQRFSSSSSTSTTTTTTSAPTTTSATTTTTTENKLVHFPSSSPETIAALLALHNAFTLSLQQQQKKVNPPPPRLINSAFASTSKPTQKPYLETTPLPPNINLNVKTRFSPSSQDYSPSSPIRQQQRPKPFYQISTPPSKSNYHHFQSGDTSFGHSFDSDKPYNFQYFHSRRIEEPTQTASISVVTSTSTSTSVKTSKPNSTDYPTGYDYTDGDLEEPYFQDVPKLREKRSLEEETRHVNHRYPDERQHRNHRYDTDLKDEKLSKEEFLYNMLDSLDMEEHDRKKLADFFVNDSGESKENSSSNGLLKRLGESIGELIRNDINKTINSADENSGSGADKNSYSQMLNDHFDEISQEVDVDFKVSDRVKRQVRRGNIDTEKFGAVENGRRKRVRTTVRTTTTVSPPKKSTEVKPVSEEVDEGDYTTAPYRRVTTRRAKSAARNTTPDYESTSRIRFNYEATTSVVPPQRPVQRVEIKRRLVRPPAVNITRDVSRLKEVVPVYEELENPASSDRVESTESSVLATRLPPSTSTTLKNSRPNRGRGRVRGPSVGPGGWTTTTSTSTVRPTLDPTLVEDPDFTCEDKIKGGFYANTGADCRGFFICSQGQVNGPLLKSHFWCGATTKFNQRSRTCQADYLVECSISHRYYHLNKNFLIPVPEEDLKGPFEAMKVQV